ncbi:hypothetical protein OPV22_027070 [Ensete ventricosum]|uniref:Uncharacterized protein n=1 Tax=Ensete ventricosum TaxID=4639 RepID=A0AAV8Q2T0_ENSVE|nr:hypothetical protein OPV22_027070 [Ensete ventricosum]
MTLNPDCVGTRNPQCSNTQLPKRLVRRRLLHRPRPRSGFAHGSPISSKSSSGSRRITPLTARLSLPPPPPPPSWVPTTFPGRYLRHPHKVVDAPLHQDDFYLNLVDRSSHIVLAVGLVCIPNHKQGDKLCDLGNRDGVCAFQWSREGSVSCNWSKFCRCLICGLKWNHDDHELGYVGNDNQFLIWDQHSQRPLLKLIEHTAPVKAITQAPQRHSLVAARGGTAYWCIHFWNTCDEEHAQLCGHEESNLQSSMDDLQVCNLQVWTNPSMSKVDASSNASSEAKSYCESFTSVGLKFSSSQDTVRLAATQVIQHFMNYALPCHLMNRLL